MVINNCINNKSFGVNLNAAKLTNNIKKKYNRLNIL